MFAIRFAKKKAYAERNIELDLLQKLEEMNLRIDATPENSSLVNEARRLKIELDEIAVQRTKQTRPGVLGIRYLGRFLPRYSVFCAKIFRYRVSCITIILGICYQRFCIFKVYWYPRGKK